MMWRGKARGTRRSAFGAYGGIAGGIVVGIISASLLSGCGSGSGIIAATNNTPVFPTPTPSPTPSPSPTPPPRPDTSEQRITLVVTNTGNANVQAGTYPLTGTPNGRFVNIVQVRGDYAFTLGSRAFASTFTLGNSTNTELQVGDTVDLSVFRIAYTQTGPGTSFYSWRSRRGTARITAIYDGSIYMFTLENVIMEPEPSATNNSASGSFTVNGDGYVVITN